MFRKINKPQLTKIKQHFIGIRAFDSRLYLDISGSFKCPKCSITCGLSKLQFVDCFCIARILVSSDHKLCQI